MAAAGSLVLIATGSSASIVLPAYLTEIRATTDFDLTVVMTATAQRFVLPEVVGWFARTVISADSPGVNPIELALGAEAIVVLPASGNTIASAALGLMATQATTVIAASPHPCLHFPQMHAVVWGKPTMVRHIAALRESGDVVVEPDSAPRFEISSGQTRVGLCMPGPVEAAKIIRSWLDDRQRSSSMASAAPVSGVPVSGVPVSGVPVSGVPASAPPGVGSPASA